MTKIEENVEDLKHRIYLLESSVYSQSYEIEIQNLKKLIAQLEEKITNALADELICEMETAIKNYIEDLSLDDFYRLLYEKHCKNVNFDKRAEYYTLLKLYNNDYYKTVRDIENAKFH